MKLSPTATAQLIEALGGTRAVARIFEVSPPSISGWKLIGIPTKRLAALRKIARTKPAGMVWTALVAAGVNPHGPLGECLSKTAADSDAGRIDAPGQE